jgi:hypothetical protein
MIRFAVFFLFGFATAYAGWESLPPSAAREVVRSDAWARDGEQRTVRL